MATAAAARASKPAKVSAPVEVMGRGVDKQGRTVYAVASSQDANHWYLVTIFGGSVPRLHCDCPASRYHRDAQCKHRQAVMERRQAEREASRQIAWEQNAAALGY